MFSLFFVLLALSPGYGSWLIASTHFLELLGGRLARRLELIRAAMGFPRSGASLVELLLKFWHCVVVSPA